MKARLVVHITAADVGRRVSVRSRLPEQPGQPSMTDTLGTLLSWDNGVLRIQRRDGSITSVAETDLAAGKIIGDPPRRARGGYAAE